MNICCYNPLRFLDCWRQSKNKTSCLWKGIWRNQKVKRIVLLDKVVREGLSGEVTVLVAMRRIQPPEQPSDLVNWKYKGIQVGKRWEYLRIWRRASVWAEKVRGEWHGMRGEVGSRQSQRFTDHPEHPKAFCWGPVLFLAHNICWVMVRETTQYTVQIGTLLRMKNGTANNYLRTKYASWGCPKQIVMYGHSWSFYSPSMKVSFILEASASSSSFTIQSPSETEILIQSSLDGVWQLITEFLTPMSGSCSLYSLRAG